MKTESMTIGKGKDKKELFYIKLAPNIFLIDQNILLIFLKTKLGTGNTAIPVRSRTFKYGEETMKEIKKAFASIYEEQTVSKKHA